MKCETRPIRVVKIGGSLLEIPDLPNRISSWSSNQPVVPTVWVVGGGKQVDDVRRQNDVSPMDLAEAHWRCIEIMDNNSQRVANWFPEWTVSTEVVSGIATANPPMHLILLTGDWIRANGTLPECWDVTSDSIALEVAKTINATELVLLKSCVAPETNSISDLSKSGIVDGYFATSADDCDSTLTLRMVNFRSAEFSESNFQISTDHSSKDHSSKDR